MTIVYMGKQTKAALDSAKSAREAVEDTREFNRLSMRPSVKISHNMQQDHAEWYIVYNHGLGPAEIRWFALAVDGAIVDSYCDMARALGYSGFKYSFRIVTVGEWIRPDVSSSIFRVEHKDAPGFANFLRMSGGDRITMKLCTCSVYGECSIETNLHGLSTAVAACDGEYPEFRVCEFTREEWNENERRNSEWRDSERRRRKGKVSE